MLIAKGVTNGKELLLLGLSRGNLKKLQEGNPIRISEESHGEGAIPGTVIVIMFAETEADLQRMLHASGMVAPDCETHVDPRLDDRRN